MRTFFLLGIFLGCFFNGMAQVADTALARVYLDSIAILIDSAEYDNALDLTSKAKNIYELANLESGTLLADTYYYLADIYSNSKEVQDTAFLYALKALEIRNKVLNKDNIKLAETYNKLGSISYKKRNYTEAQQYFEEALKINFNNDNFLFVEIYNNLGLTNRRLENFDKSIEYHKKALDIKLSQNPYNGNSISKSYRNIANTYLSLRKNEEALEYLKQALEAQSNSTYPNYKQIALIHNVIGVVYKNKANYEQALIHYKKAIKNLPKNDSNLGYIYGNLGVLYKKMNNYKKAKHYYVLALEVCKDKLGESHLQTINTYTNLGNIYNRLGNRKLAKEYFQLSLKKNLEKFGKNHSRIAHLYNNLGIVYYLMGNDQKALEYHKQALIIREAIFDENHHDVITSYHNMGLVNRVYNSEKAIKYLQRALNGYIENYGINNGETALLYSDLGRQYHVLNEYEKADFFYQKALDIHKILNSKIVFDIFGHIGNTNKEKGDYHKAIKFYEKAIESMTNSEIDNKLILSGYHHSIGIIYGELGDTISAINYHIKAYNLVGLDWNSPNLEGLEFSSSFLSNLESLAVLQPFDNTNTLPDQRNLIRNLHKIINHYYDIIDNPEFRSEFRENHYSIYETSLQLAEDWTPREKEKEFSFVEQSKTNMLLFDTRNNYIDSYRTLPDSLQNHDHNLKLDIVYYEKKRFEEENKAEKNDSLVTTYNNEIFTLKREQDDLMTTLQQDYPDYYQLKYDNTTATVEEIQELLTDDQALVEYFVGDSTVFIFTLTPTDYEVTNIKKDFPLEEWVSQVRDGIYLSQANEVKRDSFQQQYAEAAYQLYEKIIAPIPIELPQRLIIVPDGALGYLPFDALLQSKAKDSEWKTYDYLLRDHAISYNYSATLYQQICAKEHPKQSKRLLAVAPSFGDERTDNYLATRSIDELRDTLTPLKYNLPEVAYLYETIGGDTLIGQNATMSNFQQMAKDYQIVHLSTHGKANDQVGDYSYLAFTETKDSIENEKLYVRDLYNLELNADMVVLSACETGLGELKRGEGIIGMTRGFMYAGTKSIITSLWKVDDSGTKEMMGYFYDNLRAGMTKDIAMQQAKLQLLDRDKPEPFYWASFTPIGDMEALDFGFRLRWWYVLGLLLVAIPFFFIILKKS